MWTLFLQNMDPRPPQPKKAWRDVWVCCPWMSIKGTWYETHWYTLQLIQLIPSFIIPAFPLILWMENGSVITFVVWIAVFAAKSIMYKPLSCKIQFIYLLLPIESKFPYLGRDGVANALTKIMALCVNFRGEDPLPENFVNLLTKFSNTTLIAST